MNDQELINARACPECDRLRAELGRANEALANAKRVYDSLCELLGQKCLPCQLSRFIGEKMDSLKAENARLRAELEQAKAELLEVVGLIQRLQPRGSPPPGGTPELVRWIVQTRGNELEDNTKAYSLAINTSIEVQEQLKQAKAENVKLAAALKSFVGGFTQRDLEMLKTKEGHRAAGEMSIHDVLTAVDVLRGSSTALRELLGPTLAIIDELRCHVIPQLATKAELELTRLRAVMEPK